ncbi:hypothetical protein J6590_035055 [Homalodisca vitripennis]|nr:hypothetical protein J6590_035055 [Homalodisca vitripennis]
MSEDSILPACRSRVMVNAYWLSNLPQLTLSQITSLMVFGATVDEYTHNMKERRHFRASPRPQVVGTTGATNNVEVMMENS